MNRGPMLATGCPSLEATSILSLSSMHAIKLRYQAGGWAGRFLDDSCRQTMRWRIEPMKKIVRYVSTANSPLITSTLKN